LHLDSPIPVGTEVAILVEEDYSMNLLLAFLYGQLAILVSVNTYCFVTAKFGRANVRRDEHATFVDPAPAT